MQTVTIVMPISRVDYLRRIFAQLEMLDCDSQNVSLLTYVDGPLDLFQKARNFTVNSKFAERLCVYRKKGSPNVGGIHQRRKRIAAIHNEIKEHISDKNEFVFLVEDDGLFPTRTLKKLTQRYLENTDAGFISGIEIGRWGHLHIGAWEFDDIYNPTTTTSPPKKEGIHKIDAAGLYCCLTKTKTYLKHNFEPLDKALGPDAHFGLTLRQKGFLNYVDYDVQCIHLTKRGMITVEGSDVVQVQLSNNGDNKKNWAMKTL